MTIKLEPDNENVNSKIILTESTTSYYLKIHDCSDSIMLKIPKDNRGIRKLERIKMILEQIEI